ncbi:putative bifunctional diguanylate cyclase/phosphodiesterase [Geodermatophilus sabuli]|uniref:PAS domain S-box-containing protein/diguanylate cyclase (GGDEF) domain-containing protein n=1 Tax=Geodermatophilus sabuli TaxID=1564158 RepID=A0A285E7M3_9ACTN|nr:EAL domain-containing protein [Geodermatophilus sabuli]MBB3082921.1 diguanylate cyclase (GGDEF)-like protein/PAS domain S-box-containing protein [Geodermatophilus sabuli]SNX94214.1 PAS domain S-box-containing protein/diguanylate cyclase (GGDEF) domain-containing protein [Geodermatophilus sabuli]
MGTASFHRTGRRARSAAGWPALAAAALVTYASVHGTWAADVVYLLVMGIAAAVAWWGAARQGVRSAAVPVALGLSLTVVGDVVWFLYKWTGGVPDVSVGDAAYLTGYLALAVGLWRMANTRGRSRGQQLDGWLDGAGVFVAVLMLVWQLSVAGTVTDSSLPVLSRVVWALYPALDAALIGLVFRLVTTRSRGERAPIAVAAGAACWLASDLGFLLMADVEVVSVSFDTGWLLGALLLAAAAGSRGRLQRTPAEPVDAVPSLARLAVSLGALLVPAGLEVLRGVTGADGAPVTVLGGTAVLASLVFLRVARVLRAEAAARALVRSQQRHSAALARHSSDAVLVLDEEGRLLSDPTTLTTLLGVAPVATLSGGELLELSGVDRALSGAVLREALQAGGAVVDAELPCRRDGELRWMGVRLADLRTDPDVGGVVVHLTDITDRKRAEEALAHQAFHDTLTGLANRALFADSVDRALQNRARGGPSAAVVFIDLDGFKAVNDTLGHQAGDALLRQVADRLRSAVRAGDTVARLGGDEFAVLVQQPGDRQDEAGATAARVLDVLARPIELAGQRVAVTGSIGIAVAHDDATGESLVRDADIAMYAAKVAGRGRAVVFDPAMRTAAVERRRLEQELTGALARDEFRLVYQPVVDLADDRVVGFEALLRWRSPELGAVPPDVFVPVAEDLGLIGDIGAWVLREACRTAAAWRREHGVAADATMAVNVSAVQLASPQLLEDVRAALAASGLPASALVLEVTETALVDDPERAAASLTALRALGVQLALDDFGTGYSSLGYLQEFTVDVLKIDRSFVATIPADGELPPIVRGLIDLARALDLEVVAEGVETPAQRARLQAGRCARAQGYLFAAPLEATDAELLLVGQRPGAAVEQSRG